MLFIAICEMTSKKFINIILSRCVQTRGQCLYNKLRSGVENKTTETNSNYELLLKLYYHYMLE